MSNIPCCPNTLAVFVAGHIYKLDCALAYRHTGRHETTSGALWAAGDNTSQAAAQHTINQFRQRAKLTAKTRATKRANEKRKRSQ